MIWPKIFTRDALLDKRMFLYIENVLDELGAVMVHCDGNAGQIYKRITSSDDEWLSDRRSHFLEALYRFRIIASSSILTDMIKGKTLAEAARISNRDIAQELGGLPEEKMHCSVMGMEALEAAIADYRGVKYVHTEDEGGELVCKCFGVTDKKIERVVRENNLTTLEQVTNYTKAGGACGSCHWKIEEILRKVKAMQGQACPAPAEGVRVMTNLQRVRLVGRETEQRQVEVRRPDGFDRQPPAEVPQR